MKWGAIGAAWGTLLAGLISRAIGFAVSQYYYKIEWEYWRVGAIFLLFFTSSISMILMREMIMDYPTRLIVKGIALILYVFVGVKVGVITRGNYVLLKSILPFRRSVSLGHD